MKRILKYLFLFLIIFLVFGGFFLGFKSIKVQKIICESQFGKCNSKLQAEIGNVKKENILETRKNLNDLLKHDKSVLDYSIEFKLPLNLVVRVIERKPLIAYLLRNGKYALVDLEGIITNEASDTNLPKVISAPLDHSELQFATDLISTVYSFFKPTGSTKITPDGITFDNIAGKHVIFPLSGDRDILLGALNLIISRLPSVKEASTMGVIDLRFKNPVLR